MRTLLTFGLGLVMATAITSTAAADYPTRPITFMTMTQPGAQIDRLTRGLAQRMSKILGEPINVKNVTLAHEGVAYYPDAVSSPDLDLVFMLSAVFGLI